MQECKYKDQLQEKILIEYFTWDLLNKTGDDLKDELISNHLLKENKPQKVRLPDSPELLL